MDKEDVKQAITIMQAFVDGKTIQHYNYMTHTWCNTETPLFNWKDARYRIKPARPWYRVYLAKNKETFTVDSTYLMVTEFDVENYQSFVRWLTERIEYDICD